MALLTSLVAGRQSSGALTQLLLQMGRRQAARDQLEDCRRVMQEEWRAPPAPETLALFENAGLEKLSRDEAADRASSSFVRLPPLPTQIDLADASTGEAFFGRETELQRLTGREQPGRSRSTG